MHACLLLTCWPCGSTCSTAPLMASDAVHAMPCRAMPYRTVRGMLPPRLPFRLCLLHTAGVTANFGHPGFVVMLLQPSQLMALRAYTSCIKPALCDATALCDFGLVCYVFGCVSFSPEALCVLCTCGHTSCAHEHSVLISRLISDSTVILAGHCCCVCGLCMCFLCVCMLPM